MREFTPQDLQQELTSNVNIVLLDVREPWEFEIAHIANSVPIPMGQINMRFNEIPMDKTVVVVCHHGIRSRAVCSFLDSQDFEDIVNLQGGVDAWAKAIDPAMALYS